MIISAGVRFVQNFTERKHFYFLSSYRKTQKIENFFKYNMNIPHFFK